MKRALTDFEILRAQELLVQRATDGLTKRETEELAALGAEDAQGFDVAAAAIDLATLPREELPSDLADKVFAAALAAMGAPASAGSSTAPAVPAVAATLPAPASSRVPRVAGVSTVPIARRGRVTMLAGWITAGVAAAVAGGLWFSSPRPASPSTPGAARTSFLATADDAVKLAWSAGTEPTARALSGDIVWSGRRQQGYLRLRNLPVNDPSRARYQLWIFDRGRDPRYPVDAGLFDAVAAGETIVDVRPRIPIDDAMQFLITAEAPTGVVVSDRAHVIATAPAR